MSKGDSMEKAKDKIRKVLALLEGAKTEGEARAASLKLQQLLAKNDLTLEDVQEAADNREVEEHEVDLGGGSGTNWKERLAVVVAKNFRCDTYRRTWTRNGRTCAKKAVFVGEEGDVALAEKVFTVTVEVAMRLYKKWCREERAERKAEFEKRLAGLDPRRLQYDPWHRYRWDGWTPSAAERHGWYFGFVAGLADAYAEQVSSDEEIALAVVVPAAVREHMEGLALRVRRRSSVAVNAGARDAGYASGHSYGCGDRLAS